MAGIRTGEGGGDFFLDREIRFIHTRVRMALPRNHPIPRMAAARGRARRSPKWTCLSAKNLSSRRTDVSCVFASTEWRNIQIENEMGRRPIVDGRAPHPHHRRVVTWRAVRAPYATVGPRGFHVDFRNACVFETGLLVTVTGHSVESTGAVPRREKNERIPLRSHAVHGDTVGPSGAQRSTQMPRKRQLARSEHTSAARVEFRSVREHVYPRGRGGRPERFPCYLNDAQAKRTTRT